ncbi:MAG: DUF481 domain-containing protein [Candidatus Omnitrophica bacterium]|nr:DUF481 domain-containing protein [Candidatus Omnitrophota bacterium]
MALHLRNGDQLTGTVIAEDTNQVTILTAWTNRVHLPKNFIVSRETLALTPPVAPPSGQPTPAKLTLEPTPSTQKPAPEPGAPSKPRTPAELNQRLEEITTLYEADKITAGEYHAQRARIVDELSRLRPAELVSVPGSAAPARLPPSPPPAPAPVERVTPEQLWRERLWLTRWHGNVQFGVNLNYGTVDSQTWNGQVQAAYARDQFRHSMEYDVSYGRTEGVLSANRMSGSIKNELDLEKGQPLYAYHLGMYGYDEIRRVNFSFQEGVGLGYHLVQQSNLVVNVEWGGNYQGDYYIDQDSVQYFSLRIGEDLSWKITPKLTFAQKAQYTPEVTDYGNYKLRFEATLIYPFLKRLTLNLDVIDLYDSLPAEGVTGNDLQILSTVGYNF